MSPQAPETSKAVRMTFCSWGYTRGKVPGWPLMGSSVGSRAGFAETKPLVPTCPCGFWIWAGRRERGRLVPTLQRWKPRVGSSRSSEDTRWRMRKGPVMPGCCFTLSLEHHVCTSLPLNLHSFIPLAAPHLPAPKPCDDPSGLFIFKKKDFIYLFMRGTEREREKQRLRQRKKQAPYREPDVGLDPKSPGSRPGLKVALNHWATWNALKVSFIWCKSSFPSFLLVPFVWNIFYLFFHYQSVCFLKAEISVLQSLVYS